MKLFLSFLLISVALPAKSLFNNNLLFCFPEKRVFADPTSSKEEKVAGKSVEENKLVISKSGKYFSVDSRDRKDVKHLVSGEYEYFYGDSINIKVDSKKKTYFEFVSMGLGTITYFGKCY